MSPIVAVELSHRSFYLTVGPFELAGERRTAEWPAQWTYLREAGSLELWGGRTYVCIARRRRDTPAVPPVSVSADNASEPPQCQVVAFKGPIRAA